MRLPFLFSISNTRDQTWTAVNVASWTMAELGSAITTASVPTIKPLFTWAFPRFSFNLGSENPTDASKVSNATSDQSGPFALETIGTAPTRKNRAGGNGDLETGPGDGESEEHILNDAGSTTRPSTRAPTNSDTIEESNRIA